MIDEVARAGVKPDAVVLSVGGGGLLCGVVEGLRRNGLENVPVVAIETAGADSFAQSLAAGHRITLAGITSIATSLGARQVCEQALRWSTLHRGDDHRVLVEPACGASMALLYENSAALESFGTLLVIVCGGATATTDQLQAWSTRLP
jgi:L-serine/L-threonine ammonia-lyase